MKVTVTDLHEPFHQALAAPLPNATAVADAFHAVGVGTRVVEPTRRRVQQETLGLRGHKTDPLYRSRKLLTLAVGRLDDRGEQKLCGLPAAGDSDGQAYEACAGPGPTPDTHSRCDPAVGWSPCRRPGSMTPIGTSSNRGDVPLCWTARIPRDAFLLVQWREARITSRHCTEAPT